MTLDEALAVLQYWKYLGYWPSGPDWDIFTRAQSIVNSTAEEIIEREMKSFGIGSSNLKDTT